MAMPGKVHFMDNFGDLHALKAPKRCHYSWQLQRSTGLRFSHPWSGQAKKRLHETGVAISTFVPSWQAFYKAQAPIQSPRRSNSKSALPALAQPRKQGFHLTMNTNSMCYDMLFMAAAPATRLQRVWCAALPMHESMFIALVTRACSLPLVHYEMCIHSNRCFGTAMRALTSHARTR